MKNSLTVQNSKKAYFNCANIINFDENITQYIKEIAKLPTLSQEEEKELARLASIGDKEAKNKLIQANLKLVVNIAKKSIHSTTLCMSDLIQEGNLGLMVAIEKFNWKLGYKFSTYATWWIKQAMFKAISEQSYSMKIPVYIQETLSKYKKVKSELEQKEGKNVKNSEVAQKIGLSEEKIDTFLNVYNKALSIETGMQALGSANGTKEMSLSEIIEDEKQNVEQTVVDKELKKDIKSALECLKNKEKDVIVLRFGLEEGKKKTLEEIGNIYGVTKECIRQIEKRAIKKISSTKSAIQALECYII